MGDQNRIIQSEDMATTSTAVTTVPPQLQEDSASRVTVITLKNRTKKKERKRVVWTEDTIDNEHMNKKKSKCCCIYEKPRKFGESDSEDSDDECEHCFGHVERRHKHETTPTAVVQEESTEQSVSVALKKGEPAPVPPDHDAT